VACDTPVGILLCDLQMPDEATIEGALAEARKILGDGAVVWDAAAAGIYGRTAPRGHVWADADRIELYRPLQIDPRASRRERAAPRKAKSAR